MPTPYIPKYKPDQKFTVENPAVTAVNNAVSGQNQPSVNLSNPLADTTEARRAAMVSDMGSNTPSASQKTSGAVQKEEPAKASAPVHYQQQILDQYNNLQAEYQKSVEADETQRKAEESRKRIGAVADVISAFNNMYGVHRGGKNQPLKPSYGALDNIVERDRRIRKSNIDALRARLIQAQNSLVNADYRRGLLENDRKNAETRAREAATAEKNAESRASDTIRKWANTNSLIHRRGQQVEIDWAKIKLQAKKIAGELGYKTQKELDWVENELAKRANEEYENETKRMNAETARNKAEASTPQRPGVKKGVDHKDDPFGVNDNKDSHKDNPYE